MAPNGNKGAQLIKGEEIAKYSEEMAKSSAEIHKTGSEMALLSCAPYQVHRL